MKLLFDAHLPESLNSCFEGHDCIHTLHLDMGNATKDSHIN